MWIFYLENKMRNDKCPKCNSSYLLRIRPANAIKCADCPHEEPLDKSKEFTPTKSTPSHVN